MKTILVMKNINYWREIKKKKKKKKKKIKSKKEN
jgi:hypothetical protein